MVAVNLSGADSSFGKDLWWDKMKKLPNSIVSAGRRKGGELPPLPHAEGQAHLPALSRAVWNPGYL